MIPALTLTALFTACAPTLARAPLGPRVLAGLVAHESGGDPLAIHDNTTGRSYRFVSRAAAGALARDLIASGHSVDVGLTQINSSNFAAYHETPEKLMDPCEALRTGEAIYLDGLRRGLRIYNCGHDSSTCEPYAEAVFAAGKIADGPGKELPRPVLAATHPVDRPTHVHHVAPAPLFGALLSVPEPSKEEHRGIVHF